MGKPVKFVVNSFFKAVVFVFSFLEFVLVPLLGHISRIVLNYSLALEFFIKFYGTYISGNL